MPVQTPLTISCILGEPGTTFQAFRISTKDDTTPISLDITNGSATVPAIVLSERIANQPGLMPYTGTSTIRVTDLTNNTVYTYDLTQGASTISGSFRTLPTSKRNFSVLVSTCDKTNTRHPIGAMARMREIVDQYAATAPVLARFHPDDWGYVDFFSIGAGVDPEYSKGSSGPPENTHVAEDYAIVYAYQSGLMTVSSKWLDPDRLWLHQNIPHMISPGDHAVAGNYCRGHDSDPGVPSDSTGLGACWRDTDNIGQTGFPSAGYDPAWQDTAMDEFAAWIDDGNPQDYPGTFYWPLHIAGVNFFCMETVLTSTPWNIRSPSDTVAEPCYGTQQVADFFTFADANTADFTVHLMPTGYTKAGQPWEDRWPDEANGWKTTVDANDNLNGTNGHLVGVYGDNHNMHADVYDTFNAFCAGMIDASCVGGNTQQGVRAWSGERLTMHGRSQSSNANNADMLKGGFLHIIYTGSEAEPKLTVNFYEGGLDELTSF